jgi:hypothetical protein
MSAGTVSTRSLERDLRYLSQCRQSNDRRLPSEQKLEQHARPLKSIRLRVFNPFQQRGLLTTVEELSILE